MLYSGNIEPPIEELLNDPIAALIMARDGITRDDVWSQIEEARRKLRRRGAYPAANHFPGASATPTQPNRPVM